MLNRANCKSKRQNEQVNNLVKERDEVFTTIATFLAGICFTSILLLYQVGMAVETETLRTLIFTLTLSVIFFTFTAMSFTIKREKDSSIVFFLGNFFLGFLSLFISLYLILSLLDQMIATISVGLAGFLFVIFFVVLFFEYKPHDLPKR